MNIRWLTFKVKLKCECPSEFGSKAKFTLIWPFELDLDGQLAHLHVHIL